MAPGLPTWWTDERLNETVDLAYVKSHLRPEEQALLTRVPSFAAGLTDDTYLEWILTRARRFFLILVDVGVPDQVFGIIDDSYGRINPDFTHHYFTDTLGQMTMTYRLLKSWLQI